MAADGDEDEVCVGDEFVAAVAANLEVEPQRFCADAADVNADLLITKPLDVTLLLEAVRKSLPWRL